MEANKLQVFSSSAAETIANIEDLLTDILLRVPSRKTLTRFKSVSKHWLSLISSHSFCISHATRYKSLYICTSENHLKDLPHGYRVHAIKLRDLFSPPSGATPKPINLYSYGSSKSKSKLDSDVLRQVTCIWGDNASELPFGMGCGVMGSRIVLAGGFYKDADGFYQPKPSYALDTTEPEPMFDLSVIPDLTGHRMYSPPLLEINGKLYALSEEIFSVFDPDSPREGWTHLPKIPIRSDRIFCSVYESKIIASFPGGRTFCYDVAASDGSWKPIAPLFGYEGHIPGKALVVDSEDDYFDKLMFVAYYEVILVFGIHLSKEGVPTEYELVAKISLPKFPGSFDIEVKSSSGAYLGDGKLCFTFLYATKSAARVPLLVFTFDFTYMSSPHNNSSTSDPNIHCTSIIGLFSAKAPGYHLFEFNYADESFPVPDSLLCDCIVL